MVLVRGSVVFWIFGLWVEGREKVEEGDGMCMYVFLDEDEDEDEDGMDGMRASCGWRRGNNEKGESYLGK